MDFIHGKWSPPMGWNSWDCYGASVRESEVRQNALFMARHLKQYGYEYVTVDIQWSEPLACGTDYRNLPKLCLDEYGRQMPAPERFASAKEGRGFAPLSEYVHSLGLKFGIHILRGIPRQAVYLDLPVFGTNLTAREVARGDSLCPWNMDMYGVEGEGGQKYYDSLFTLYARWGVDFVKVDDLSYKDREGVSQYHMEELQMIRNAINACGREMVLSASPGTFDLRFADTLPKYANMWRISDDFWDSWASLKKQFDLTAQWSPFASAGHYPDADMLPLGQLSLRSNSAWNKPRATNLTRQEQKFMMSLWCMARSPLIIGGELTTMDDWTLKLLSNKDALDANQNAVMSRPVYIKEDCGAWASEGENTYVGLFNLSDAPMAVSLLLSSAGFAGARAAVDVWSGEQVSVDKGLVAVPLEGHEGTILKILR